MLVALTGPWRLLPNWPSAFFSRAYDQIRMAAISRASLCLVGSHAGASIGEDGPSQMALEDLAMLRAVHGSTVLYPSCATAAVALTREMASREGITYLRATREKTPVLYGSGERFPIGGSKVLHPPRGARGVRDAAARGRARSCRRDLYSVKPIDAATIEACARECSERLIVVEDHWPQGGLADSVCEVFAGKSTAPSIVRLAVRSMPGSGTPREQLEAAGISARHIVEAARRLAG